MRSTRYPLTLLVALVALLGVACGVDGLNFREDTRVDIVAPVDRSQVRLPVTVEWTVRDFEVTGPTGDVVEAAGYFAVLIDREPPPPGQHLAWLAKDDEGCLANQGCPDEQWFSRHGVFPTTRTSLTIDAVPRTTDRDREVHVVTVVLLDGTGHRIGESAWAVEFEVVRGRA